MKQNEWFEATSRIAEQYITEAKPKHLREAGQPIDRAALIEEKPAEAVRQSRITRWVTTGFAVAAAVAVVVTGGILVSKVRNKVPSVLNSGTDVTGTETTAVNDSDKDFREGHDAGAEAAKAAIAADRDKVIFSGTVTDKVSGIYDDQLDSSMKYVLLGQGESGGRIIHISRTLADTLTIGKTYRFTIDEQVIEAAPVDIKTDLVDLPFRSAEAVSVEDSEKNYTFRRAEYDGNASADFISGYQEGYRDVIMNIDPKQDYYELSGTLTGYVRDVFDPDLSAGDPEYADYARCMVIAESPDHKTFFQLHYPYKQKAELVKDQIMTFGMTPKGPDDNVMPDYLSKQLAENIDPAKVIPIFDTVRAMQAGEDTDWNRLTAVKAWQTGTTETTASTETEETTTTAETEARIWEYGTKLHYSGWNVLRSGDVLQFENFGEPDHNAHTAELNGGGTAVTKLKKTRSLGEPYTNDIPAYDGEKQYILKDGQVVSTDGSRVLMTGIRPEVNQHFSLNTVTKLSDGCWFVTMSEGWENGGGWNNEYWCDGKGKTVKINCSNTPSYGTIVADDGSCVYYIDMYDGGGLEDGVFRVKPFESEGTVIVKGSAVSAVRPEGDGPDGCYVDEGPAFIHNGNIYLPLRGSGDGRDCGYIIADLSGKKAPYCTESPAGLDLLFKAGDKLYGITETGVLAEYLPETNTKRTVADIRAAFAAAAKDKANADMKQDLTEMSGSWHPYNRTVFGGIWNDLVVFTDYYGINTAVNLKTGGVQIIII